MRKQVRERASVLLAAMFLTAILFGIVGSLVLVSISSSRAVTEAAEIQVALYLAEGGMEASRRELADAVDPGQDGTGVVTYTSTGGSYQATSVDLGGRIHEITSAGKLHARLVWCP